jgi:hypothetical protein
MGTSSARRAPATRLWRRAKAAAGRYFSADSRGAPAAREVAARYLAALGEDGGATPAGALAAFRLTRRVAQNLGAFCCRAVSQGWPAALEDLGLQKLAGSDPATLAPFLYAALEAQGGGLEQAVVHTALMGIWPNLPPNPDASLEAAGLVPRFLTAALHLRLLLDLGESLETAAPEVFSLRQAQAELADCLERAAEIPHLPAAPLTPADWLGLPGWTWVTHRLQGLILNLTGPTIGTNFSAKI